MLAIIRRTVEPRATTNQETGFHHKPARRQNLKAKNSAGCRTMNNKSSVGSRRGKGSGKGPRKLDTDFARRIVEKELELAELKDAEAEKANTVDWDTLPVSVKLASHVKVLEFITYDPGSPIGWKTLAKELNDRCHHVTYRTKASWNVLLNQCGNFLVVLSVQN